jgi:hypothetical protein
LEFFLFIFKDEEVKLPAYEKCEPSKILKNRKENKRRLLLVIRKDRYEIDEK